LIVTRNTIVIEWHRSPEMADLYKRELVNEKVDIWALGCILFTCAFFYHPFQEGGNLQIISGKLSIYISVAASC
jgi:AP2-associated kinase